MSDRNAQIAGVTQEILEAFRTGRLAEPLAQTFLNHGLHCERWSINNQMVVHLLGFQDAATYNQWREMGRQVRRGSKAFYLMRPHPFVVRKVDEDTGEEKRVQVGIRGFGWFAVHPYEDTEPIPGFEGEVYSLEDIAQQRREFVAGVPLVEVAEAWGIHVTVIHHSYANRVGTLAPAPRSPEGPPQGARGTARLQRLEPRRRLPARELGQ